MRLALKTGSYSLLHLTVAIAVAYAITQDWRAALAVGLIEPAVQTLAYLLHDRVWARIERRRATAQNCRSWTAGVRAGGDGAVADHVTGTARHPCAHRAAHS
jgi:uncharacterized membrane protein